MQLIKSPLAHYRFDRDLSRADLARHGTTKKTEELAQEIALSEAGLLWNSESDLLSNLLRSIYISTDQDAWVRAKMQKDGDGS